MNFGENIKEELASKPIKDKRQKLAFLSGLIRGSGVIFEKDDKIGFEFKVGSEKIVYLVSEFLSSVFSYDLREVRAVQDKINKKDKFVITLLDDNALEILLALGILHEEKEEYYINPTCPSSLLTDAESERSFIKGLFISSGTCTLPSANGKAKTGYHLQISCTHNAFVSSVSDILSKNGVRVKISRNKDKFLLYIKSAEEIKDFIAYLGAPLSVLAITDLIVNRDFINDVNRRKNCDLGNVNRQLSASYKQNEAINLIKNKLGLDSLKPDLKIVAEARLNNQDESYIELANKLNISKSCLNHRLRKLLEIAKEIKE